MKIICNTGEIVYNYRDYLKTRHWIIKKQEFRNKFIAKCCMCDYKGNGLHIHHMSYDNIGNENIDDLCFLCSICHNKIHTELKDYKDSMVLKEFRQKKKSGSLNVEYVNSVQLKKYIPKNKSKSNLKKEIKKKTTLKQLSKLLEFDLKKEHIFNDFKYKTYGNKKFSIQQINSKTDGYFVRIKLSKNKNQTCYEIIDI